MGIVAVMKVVVKVVTIAMTVVKIITSLKLDDLLADYWPAFKEARTNFVGG